MGRLPSPFRPDRRHAPAAWSARTVCWILLAVLIACTGIVAGANPATTVPIPDMPSEPPTLPPTEPPTLPPTEPPTEPPTLPPTEPPTEPPTLPPTVPPTLPPTVPPTLPPTLPPTAPPTLPPTVPPTLPPTLPPTVPPTLPPTEPPTSALNFPPSLILYPTVSAQGYQVTVDGSVGPGTAGTTITRVTWDWGDGVIEDHPVPNTHSYASVGSYTITVTALQSDGQSTTKTMTVYVSSQTEPTTAPPTTAPPGTATQPPVTAEPTPATTVGPPVLTINPPLVENETVVMGGSIQPGGPGAVIDLVIWDWGDGIRETQNTLPVTHVYRAAGEYTIGVEVIQSEIGAPEKRLTATASFPVSITQVPATYTTGTPMPNGTGFQWPTVRLLGINIFPLLVLLLVGLVIGGLLYYKSRESTSPEIPTTDAIEQAAAAYQEARERGDLAAAKQSAFDAARLLVIQAEAVPKYANAYLEKAEIWKEIAQTIDDQPAGPLPEPADVPAPVPIGSLVGTAAGADAGAAGDAGNGRGELLAGTDVEPAVFDAALRIALEIAREGREGKPVGTAFLVGDVDGVLAYSTQFILNPFKGHTSEERRITDEHLAENIKEFALLDGAFVIGGDGVVEAAGRYITVETSAVQIPAGLGSRHASVAGITLVTKTLGIVVSQSGGLIKIFKNGHIVRTVSPW